MNPLKGYKAACSSSQQFC